MASMNYELAKKLKEVGWPQNFSKDEEVFMEKSAVYYLDIATEEERSRPVKSKFDSQELEWIIKIPTLAELIEAVRFFGLKFGLSCNKLYKGEKWKDLGRSEGSCLATTYIEGFWGYKVFKCELGATPEEAVANLWLKLKK